MDHEIFHYKNTQMIFLYYILEVPHTLSIQCTDKASFVKFKTLFGLLNLRQWYLFYKESSITSAFTLEDKQLLKEETIHLKTVFLGQHSILPYAN